VLKKTRPKRAVSKAKRIAPDINAFVGKLNLEQRMVLISGILTVFKILTGPALISEWLNGAPTINTKVAGPWRGKGSFGKGFGPQGRR